MRDEPAADVLVVDDVETVRLYLRRSLEQEGFSVAVACSGEQALTMLAARDFDVVVADIIMPQMSGLELLRYVRQHYPSTETVLVSETTALPAAVQGMRLGAFDLVQKANELASLGASVRRAVERRRLSTTQALVAAANVIFASHDRMALPRRIVDACTCAFEADYASLMLNGADNRLYVAYSNGVPEAVWGHERVCLGERISGRVAKLRVPEIITDPWPTDAEAIAESKDKNTFHSAVVYPLYSRDDLLGVLTLNRRGPRIRPFRTADMEHVGIIAAQVVLALELQHFGKKLGQTANLASIGQFASSIVHEINTPLAAVVANLETVLFSLRSGDAPEVTMPRAAAIEPLSESLEAAQRIAEMVKDLQDLARDANATSAVFKLGEAVRIACKSAGPRVRSCCRLSVEIPPDVPILGRLAALAQVFANLLVNAAIALHGRPAEKSRIAVRGWRQDERVHVEVADTGCGIEPADIPLIFEPFFTRREHEGGTGFGLSLCRDVVRWHGGEIHVSSVLGEGATFRVVLPVYSDANVEQPAIRQTEAPTTEAAGTTRVLCVDDEPLLLRAYKRILCDVDVVAVESAGKAIETLKQDSAFDLIICDVIMPEGSGEIVYEHVRATCPEMLHRFVFVTGSAGALQLRQHAADAPEVRVVSKPFARTEILELIQPRRVGQDSGLC